MENSLNTPVVLFLFKRIDKTLRVLENIAKVRPKKLYLLSDGGRTEEEHVLVEACRKSIESAISWDCEVIKKYEPRNIGIYSNIGEGARWVFDREDVAIFLEDDNLPELTFFRFCEEILEKYKNDSRILWVCGSNYLKKYEPENGASYVFSQNMLPCGWASWANKFNALYDGDLDLWNDPYIRNRIKQEYRYAPLYYQDKYNIEYELDAKATSGKFYSWDYQMSFSLRAHNVYSIVPCVNQITNIGVDADATHGGNSFNNIMVERFCQLPTNPISFPLIHPKTVLIDLPFETKIAKLILTPSFFSTKARISRLLRRIFNIKKTQSLIGYFRKRIDLYK